jgi:hypothetical protein
MTDFSPAQMQEMAKMLRHDPIDDYELVAADMLEQAASQTTEIERLTKENEMQRYTLLALNRGDVREVIDVRGKWVSADECLSREIELLERAEAAESRLLALREQVEGLKRYAPEDTFDGVMNALMQDETPAYVPRCICSDEPGAAPRMDEGWRPIASAPKDGTLIVGALIDDRGRICRIHDMQYNAIGFYTVNGGSLPRMTHWMPSPLPPAPEKG